MLLNDKMCYNQSVIDYMHLNILKKGGYIYGEADEYCILCL